MNAKLDTMAELNAIKDFFSNAQNQLQQGHPTDMAGLDQRIATVCLAVQHAEPAQQQIFLPHLNDLIGLLDLYEQDLKRLQGMTNVNAAKITQSN